MSKRYWSHGQLQERRPLIANQPSVTFDFQVLRVISAELSYWLSNREAAYVTMQPVVPGAQNPWKELVADFDFTAQLICIEIEQIWYDAHRSEFVEHVG
jgi:hypothetical protein